MTLENTATITDLKAIMDEAQSQMVIREDSDDLEDYEYWKDVFDSTEKALHERIKVLFPITVEAQN